MRLFFRSFLLLLALWGLVFAVGDLYLAKHGAPPWFALIFAVCFVGFQYWVGPYAIQFFLKIRWDDFDTELPIRNREFLQGLCAERQLKMPRIGIIDSATPNAFTFGHTRSNARVVVTTGLLKILTPEEANAVLAHEMGHVAHNDFIVMTLAGLVPLVLYQLYAFARSDKRIVAIAAYLAYWLSQYLTFMLSRTREYFADQYAARATRTPDALASALVKIAYGIFKANGELLAASRNAEKEEKARLGRERVRLGSVAVMGISNLGEGRALALSAPGGAAAAAIMRWDLVNPWARLYEFQSTHPLTALRIQALNHESEAMHHAVSNPLPADRQVQWGSFAFQVLVWVAPGLCAMAAILSLGARFYDLQLSGFVAPALLTFTGLAWLLRTTMRYPAYDPRPTTIAQLVEDIEVSEMQPRAVRLEGTIVGHGVPGAYYCADLVLQDPTGLMFVLFKQPIPLSRLIFAISEAEGLIGEKVVIEGWFRRGLRPYVEFRRITDERGHSVVTRSRRIYNVIGSLLTLAGLVWLLLAR